MLSTRASQTSPRPARILNGPLDQNSHEQITCLVHKPGGCRGSVAGVWRQRGGWLLVLADGAGRVALRVHRAEEPERFVWIGVEKLVRFFRRYVDQVERAHVKALVADTHAAAAPHHQDRAC